MQHEMAGMLTPCQVAPMLLAIGCLTVNKHSHAAPRLARRVAVALRREPAQDVHRKSGTGEAPLLAQPSAAAPRGVAACAVPVARRGTAPTAARRRRKHAAEIGGSCGQRAWRRGAVGVGVPGGGARRRGGRVRGGPGAAGGQAAGVWGADRCGVAAAVAVCEADLARPEVKL
eukprot:362706-Chlamydomonas_euryale.AAC.3